MSDTVNGVLTTPTKKKYNESQLADDLASASARTEGKKSLFEATLEKLREGGPQSGLPKFEEHPDWVFAWVSTDPRMSADNAMTRLQQGWKIADKKLQPTLAAAISATPDYHAASSGSVIQDAIQYRDVVLLMLEREVHDARIHYYHQEVPRKREEDFAQIQQETAKYGQVLPDSRLKSARETHFTRYREST
jgi:hypothetical protein